MVFILRRLGFVPRAKEDRFAADKAVSFGVPSWRWDISAEADLVEEIARVYGLDNIPDTMPSAPSVSPLSDAPFRAVCRVHEVCEALGFSEALHYSFLSARELDDFDPRPEARARRLAIPDPVSAEYGVMRDSLLPQLYAALGRNASHEETAMLFETGKVFHSVDGKPAEKAMLALGFCGPAGREALRRRAPLGEEEAALWMKGAVEELVSRLHAGKLEFAPASHPAFSAALEVKVNGRAVGVLGAVSAKMRHPFRLTTQMALCEVELGPLMKRVDAAGRVSPVPQFPAVRRDIAQRRPRARQGRPLRRLQEFPRLLARVPLRRTHPHRRRGRRRVRPGGRGAQGPGRGGGARGVMRGNDVGPGLHADSADISSTDAKSRGQPLLGTTGSGGSVLRQRGIF